MRTSHIARNTSENNPTKAAQPEFAPKQGQENIPEESQGAYRLVLEKIKRLQGQLVIATDPATKFKLEQDIAEAKKDMQQLLE